MVLGDSTGCRLILELSRWNDGLQSLNIRDHVLRKRAGETLIPAYKGESEYLFSVARGCLLFLMKLPVSACEDTDFPLFHAA